MKLSCSSSTTVSDLLMSGISFELRRKPTDADLKDYFISISDPSVQESSELSPDSTLSENGITEGSSLIRTVGWGEECVVSKRSAKDAFSLRVKYNDTTVSVDCQPSSPLQQVVELAMKQFSLPESLEVTGVTSNNGRKMQETKTVAENGLHSGTIVIGDEEEES